MQAHQSPSQIAATKHQVKMLMMMMMRLSSVCVWDAYIPYTHWPMLAHQSPSQIAGTKHQVKMLARAAITQVAQS